MKTFKDAKGREWTVDITVAAVRRIKDLAQVDLLTLLDKESDIWASILRSPVLLGAVLHAACRPQMDGKPLSREEFDEGLAGKAITDALVAFEEDLISFFPAHLQAAVLEAMLAANSRAMERMRTAVASFPTDGGGSTNSPASSDATPAPSPSAGSS